MKSCRKILSSLNIWPDSTFTAEHYTFSMKSDSYANHLELVGSVNSDTGGHGDGHGDGNGNRRQLQDTHDQKQELHLLWEMKDCKTLRVRLVFNDHLSWLSIGIPKEGGYHNGMNGGHIIMGTAESGYYEYGEFKTVPHGVGSYIIHERDSAFSPKLW